MGNKIQKTVEFKFTSDVSNVTQSVNQLEQKMRNVKMPENSAKGILSQIAKLKTELAKVQSQTKDGVVKIDEADSVAKSGQKIKLLYTELIAKVKQLGTLSNKEMRELFPEEIASQINGAEKAMDNYAKAIKNANKEIKKQEEALEEAKKAKEEASKNLSIGKNKKVVSDEVSKSRSKKLKENQAILNRKSEIESDYQRIASKAGTRKDGGVSRRGMSEADKAIVNEYEELSKIAGEAAEKIKEIENAQSESITTKELEKLEKAYDDAGTKVDGLQNKINSLKGGKNTAFDDLIKKVKDLDVDTTGIQNIEQLKQKINGMDAENIEKIRVEMGEFENSTEEVKDQVDGLGDKIGEEFKQAADSTKRANQSFDEMSKKVQLFFGMSNAIQLFKRTLREAFNSVKELDSAMKEIAVVSEYDISDMWGSLPQFTKQANQLGVAITEVYDATGLYVQQGLDLVESQGLANETLKMAKIAGMDAAAATDAMTSALRGFNMELNQGSAEKVNDIYSKLAAITASDTQEIATAMSKTASIASNAGASIENTAAFLSQIIETTRESAETAGTALKTVIARFSELKKDPSEIGDVDGEIVDANAIESALKLAGVQLRDTSGQFKEFDKVIIELSGKWDSLDKNTQRYIATIAAGSRQQSRFLALMSDNERLMQLTDAAYNSTGASQTQFNKTLDSMKSKLNQLKNAWDTFTRNLMNSSLLKAGVDILTKVLNAINGITNAFQNMNSVAGSILSGTLMATFFLLGKQLTTKLATSAKTGLVSFFTDVLQQFQTQTGLIGSEGANAGSQYGAQFQASSESAIQTWYQNFLLKIQELKQKLADLAQSMNASAGTAQAQNRAPVALLGTGQPSTPKYKIGKELRGGGNRITFDDGTPGAIRNGRVYNNKNEDIGAVEDFGGGQTSNTPGSSNKQIPGSNKTQQIQGDKDPLLLTDGTKKQIDEVNKSTEKLHFNAQKTGAAFVAVGVASSFMAQQLRKNGNDEAAEVVEKIGAGLTTVGMALTTIGPLISSVGKALKNMTATQMKSMGKWTIILAIATAIFMIIKNIVDIISKNTLDGKLKSITDATQKATETAQKAQEAYSNWLSDKNEYNGLIEALEELTEGTVAWEEQMDKVQDKIYEMINTYPELAKYVKDGKIDNQGLQELDERLKKEKQLALSNKVGVQMTKDELQYQKDIKDLNKEKRKNKDSSKDEDYWNKRFEELESNYNKTYQGNINFLLQNSGIDANLSDNITSALTKQNSSHNYGSNTQKTIDQIGGKYNTHQSIENAAWWTAGGTAATMAGIGMVNGAAALSAMTASAGAAAAAAAGGATAAAAAAAGTAAATAAATAATGMAATAATTVATAATTAATAAATAAAGGATVAAATAAGTAAAGGATTALVAGLSAIPVAGWVAAAAVAVTAITTGVVKAIQKNEKKKDIQKAYAEMLGKSIEDIDEETLKDVDKMSAELAAYKQNKILEQKAKATEAEILNMGPVAQGLFSNDMSLLDMDYSEFGGFDKWIESLKNGVNELTTLSLEDAVEKFEAEKQEVTKAVEEIFGDKVKLNIDIVVDGTIAISGKTAQRLKNARESLTKAFGENSVKELDLIMGVYGVTANSVEELSSAYSKLGEAATITQKAIAAKELIESGQEAPVALGATFYKTNAAALSATNQIKEFYMNLSSDNLNELFKNGKLTAKSVYELKGSFTDLDGIIDTTDISMATLGDALNDLKSGVLELDDLTLGFIETLDKLNKASHIIEDAMAKATSFKDPERGTVIGEKTGNIAKELLKIYTSGAFGDPAIETYFDYMFGEEAWDNALKKAEGSAKKALEKYMASIYNLAEENNYFSFWDNAVGIGDGLWSTNGEEITFHLEGYKDLDKYIDAIVKATGRTKDFIEAALADAAIYSDDLQKAFDSRNAVSGLNSYLNGLEVIDNSVQLNLQQLEKIYNDAFSDGRSIFANFYEFLGAIQDGYKKQNIATTLTETKTFEDISQIQADLLAQKNKYNATNLLKTFTSQVYESSDENSVRDLIKGVFKRNGVQDAEAMANNVILTPSEVKYSYDSYIENEDETPIPTTVQVRDYSTGDSSATAQVNTYTEAVQSAFQTYINQGLTTLEAQQEVLKRFGKGSAIYDNFLGPIVTDQDKKTQEMIDALLSTEEGIASWVTQGYSDEEANLIKQADLINRGTLKAVDYLINSGVFGKVVPTQLDQNDYQINEVKLLNTFGTKNQQTSTAEQTEQVQIFNFDEGILKYSGLVDAGADPTSYGGDTEEDLIKKAKEIDFDWLHNLNELGEKAVRDLEKLQAEYELGIKNLSMSSEQIADNWAGRLEAIQTETYVAQAKAAHAKTRAEGFYDKNKDELGKYISYDADAGMTRINYDELETVKANGDLSEKAKKLLEELENDTELINEAEQLTFDNNLKQLEILEEIDSTIIDFENQVKDMIVESYQREIDKLSDIDSSINDANAKLISSIQSSVDRYRQDRENEDTEQNITDMQNRLALLRADTTGANQQEIMSLEKELGQAQEDYTDTLIDQKISALQEQNEEASAQRQQQIEIANAQLESAQESGQINKDMQDILAKSQNFNDPDNPLLALWTQMNGDQGLSASQWAQNLKTLQENASAFYGAEAFKQKYTDEKGINADLADRMKTILTAKDLDINKALKGWKLKTDAEVKKGVSAALKEYKKEQDEKTATVNESKNKLLSKVEDLKKKHTSTTNGKTTFNKEGFMTELKGTQEYKDYVSKVGDETIAQATLGNALKVEETGNTSVNVGGKILEKNLEKKSAKGFYASSIPLLGSGGETIFFKKKSANSHNYECYNPTTSDFDEWWGIDSDIKKALEGHKIKYLGENFDPTWEKWSYEQFKTGGLNIQTGPAWLDGTPSKPELVLNSTDTQNFLQLKDILSDIMRGGSFTTNQKDGDLNLEIYLNVEQGISSDYDVEQLVNKVKQEIVRVGTERNIQILTKR